MNKRRFVEDDIIAMIDMSSSKKASRCEACGRIIREHNKSGLCYYCGRAKNIIKRTKLKNKCKCGKLKDVRSKQCCACYQSR